VYIDLKTNSTYKTANIHLNVNLFLDFWSAVFVMAGLYSPVSGTNGSKRSVVISVHKYLFAVR